MSLRRLLREIKRYVEKSVGTFSHELYWIMRSRSWALRYLSDESITHPHRNVLIDILKKSGHFVSLLEVGCASGPNVYRIATAFPHAQIFGTDINRSAIRLAQRWFKEKKLENVTFMTKKIGDLRHFADKSIDIILSDAALLYVGPDTITQVVSEFLRVAKKKIILVEMYSPDVLHRYEDTWAHNYIALFKPYIDEKQIHMTKITDEIWGGDWAKKGYFIEITLKEGA